MKKSKTPAKLPPLPRLVFCEVVYDGASITLESDPLSKYGGAISPTQMIRMACPASMLEDFFTWILIQKERKRLDLPYLTAEEMGPVRRSY